MACGGVKKMGLNRIDIRNLDDETVKKLDEQRKKLGIGSRVDYIRMLIHLDIMTNIAERIKNEDKKPISD